MVSLSIKRMETDVLIIGAEGAGCFAAIKAAGLGAKVIGTGRGSRLPGRVDAA